MPKRSAYRTSRVVLASLVAIGSGEGGGAVAYAEEM